MIDRLFQVRCTAELRQLLTAVEKSRGRPTVLAALTFSAPVTNPAARAQGIANVTSELPPACMMSPLQLADWLDGQGTRLPHDIARLLTLYAYVLCIEVRYVYATIGNLLGALASGKTRKGLGLYRVTSAKACFNQIETWHGALKKPLPIIATWGGFLDFELRNIIGHSDFVLTGLGGIVPVHATMQRLTTTGAPRSVYPPKLLEGLYRQARAFLEAFFETTAGYTSEP